MREVARLHGIAPGSILQVQGQAQARLDGGASPMLSRLKLSSSSEAKGIARSASSELPDRVVAALHRQVTW
jgi:hypothetical protein